MTADQKFRKELKEEYFFQKNLLVRKAADNPNTAATPEVVEERQAFDIIKALIMAVCKNRSYDVGAAQRILWAIQWNPEELGVISDGDIAEMIR